MTLSTARAAWRDDPVRERALAASGLFGSGPERSFDDLAVLAAQICEAPIAYVSVMARERQWFKAKVGIGISEVPVESSVCIHTMQHSGLFVIHDLSKDPRTATYSFVTQPPFARFYAALRIHTPDKQPVGTLCVMDYAVRLEGLTEPQSTALIALARQVESQIALRQSSASLDAMAPSRKQMDVGALPDNVTQLAWMAEPDGTIYWFNDSWFAYTGFDPLTAEGMEWRRAYRPEDVDDICSEVAEYWAAGEPWQRICHLRSATGVYRPFLTRVEPVKDENGAVIRWFGTNTDISAQAEVEQRLRELNNTLERRIADAQEHQLKTDELLRQAHKMEAVGQLTGGIAHDFNNLLTAVTGNLELLSVRLGQGRTHDLERYIDAAHGAARRAAALTKRLLAFSRRAPLEPKPTYVDKIVFGIDDMIRRTLGPSIHLDIVAADGLWPTLVDPSQVENALLNLCINAHYAMPQGGTLTIAIANLSIPHDAVDPADVPPGQYVALSVRDTGMGMPPDVIARAFDPFFTTKPVGVGTGLGLSMVNSFARQSEGHARIASAPGQGTTVSIYLPRHRDTDLIELPPATLLEQRDRALPEPGGSGSALGSSNSLARHDRLEVGE
jgi:PAS domain S-box-containing protein